MKPPLLKHQKSFLDKNLNKSALIHSCGLGKSRTACEWSGTDSVLVICPKALQTNWLREMKKWRIKNLHLVRIMSKENFKKSADTLENYNQVIVDEIHTGFLTPNFKSQMSKSLKNYLKKHDVKRFLACTATCYSSSPWNIFVLAHYLGYKWDWQKFNYTFFNQVRMGPRIVPIPKKGCEVELAKLTKKIADVVNIEDVIDVPEQLHCDPEYFALSARQKKMIEEAYDPLPIVRFTAQHQIEQMGDKTERLIALCEENPKIAIVCRYNAQIDALAQNLAKFKPLIIRGDVKDRDKVCLEAEKADRAVVIIQADCGIGFELPSFPVCVFASMSYSYTSWEQMCGRFLRMNKASKTTFLYLLTEGDSVDQAVYDCIKRKEDFKIELFKK